MFSKDLEHSIHRSYQLARDARHEYMTVEHLLLALLDNPAAQEVLRACHADSERLRRSLQERPRDRALVAFDKIKIRWGNSDAPCEVGLGHAQIAPPLADARTKEGSRQQLLRVSILDRMTWSAVILLTKISFNSNRLLPR